MVSCQEFNNIKANNASTFNMIHTLPFLEKNIDNHWKKKTNDEKPEDE